MAQIQLETSTVQLVLDFIRPAPPQTPAEQAAGWLEETTELCSVRTIRQPSVCSLFNILAAPTIDFNDDIILQVALRKDPAVVALFVKFEETRLHVEHQRAQESSRLGAVVGKMEKTVIGHDGGVRTGIRNLGVGVFTGVNDLVKGVCCFSHQLHRLVVDYFGCKTFAVSSSSLKLRWHPTCYPTR